MHRVRIPRSQVEALKRGRLDGALHGQDRLTGLVRELELPPGFLQRVLDAQAGLLIERLGQVLTRCSAALRLDVQRSGAVFVGHGCLVPGLTQRLERDLGLAVVVPSDPGRSLIGGLVRLARPNPDRRPRPEPATDLLPLEV